MAHRGRKNADEVFLTALACGATVEHAAEKAGIARRTAHRRLQDPEFQGRLSQLKADMLKRATAMLTAASMEAVKTLLGLQAENMPPGIRLGAARSILEIGNRLRDSTELFERVEAVERHLESDPNPLPFRRQR
jgi:hypothetical protein